MVLGVRGALAGPEVFARGKDVCPTFTVIYVSHVHKIPQVVRSGNELTYLFPVSYTYKYCWPVVDYIFQHPAAATAVVVHMLYST